MPTRAFNEFLYEFLRIFLISENSLKFANFFAEVTNSRSVLKDGDLGSSHQYVNCTKLHLLIIIPTVDVDNNGISKSQHSSL